MSIVIENPAKRVSPPLGHALLLLIALFVCGCASAPPEAELPEELPIPERWVQQQPGADGGVNDAPATNANANDSDSDSDSDKAPRVLDLWWEAWGDEQLDAFVAEALTQNPDLAIAATRVEAAAAAARAVGANYQPFLSGGFTAERQRSQFRLPGVDDPIRQRRNNFGISLNLSWEIDLWGRLRAGHAAAIADAEQSEANYYAARLSLVAQTIKAYLQILDSQQQLEISEANLDSTQNLGERIEERYRSGLRTALDLQLIRDTVASAQSEAARARLELDQARRQLELLLGRHPAGTIELSGTFPPLPDAPPAGLPSELVERRPDLMAAERGYASALARHKQARLDLLPRIALTASAGTSSEELSDVLDSDFGVWNLAGNLTAPIFEGGRLQAEIDRREAEVSSARANYEAAIRSAFGDVEAALAGERHLAEITTAVDRAVGELSRSLEISERRYFQGLEEILTILESRRRLFVGRSTLLRSQREQLVQRVDLYVALGGGFTRPDHQHPNRQAHDPNTSPSESGAIQ